MSLVEAPRAPQTPTSVEALAQTDNLRAALLELEAVDREHLRRRQEHGYAYFTPNQPQLQALQAKTRIVAYVGGNRAGKSHVGAAWLTAHLTHVYRGCACHGEWFAPTLRRPAHPQKAVIVVTEFQKIESVIEPKLMALLPKAWIKERKRTPQGYLRRLVGVDGSLIDVLSGEQDSMAFEGQDWDLAWIDEPTAYSRWVAIQRGLTDRAGLTFLSFTPLVEPWMKERLVDQADGTRIDVVQADSYANLEDIHKAPIQKRENLVFLESLMTEDERSTRIHGQFFHLRGVVYKEFLPAVHEREWAYTPGDPVINVLDPHTRKPHWLIWAFLNRHDQLCVDRELAFEGTLQDMKREVIRLETAAGYRMARRLIDPNYGRWNLITTGRTVIDELARAPFALRYQEANDDKEAGLLKVRDALRFDRSRPMDLQNQPVLYFHRERCRGTIRSIRNLQYDEWKGKTKEDRDAKEATKPKDDDGADCIRYLVMNEPHYDTLKSRLSPHATDLVESPY